MIYLSDYRLAYSTNTQLLDELRHPQVVNWFPETYDKIKTGLVYPPHKVAEKVIDQALAKELREDTQALVLQDFKAVGVEAYVENAP